MVAVGNRNSSQKMKWIKAAMWNDTKAAPEEGKLPWRTSLSKDNAHPGPVFMKLNDLFQKCRIKVQWRAAALKNGRTTSRRVIKGQTTPLRRLTFKGEKRAGPGERLAP